MKHQNIHWWFDLILFLVLNATFSNISAILWWPVLVVVEAGENPDHGQAIIYWCFRPIIVLFVCLSHHIHSLCTALLKPNTNRFILFQDKINCYILDSNGYILYANTDSENVSMVLPLPKLWKYFVMVLRAFNVWEKWPPSWTE